MVARKKSTPKQGVTGLNGLVEEPKPVTEVQEVEAVEAVPLAETKTYIAKPPEQLGDARIVFIVPHNVIHVPQSRGQVRQIRPGSHIHIEVMKYINTYFDRVVGDAPMLGQQAGGVIWVRK